MNLSKLVKFFRRWSKKVIRLPLYIQKASRKSKVSWLGDIDFPTRQTHQENTVKQKVPQLLKGCFLQGFPIGYLNF